MKEHELRRVLRAADEAVTVDGLEELVRCLERGFDSNHASIARFGGPRGFDIAVGDKAAMNYEHYATHIFPGRSPGRDGEARQRDACARLRRRSRRAAAARDRHLLRVLRAAA